MKRFFAAACIAAGLIGATEAQAQSGNWAGFYAGIFASQNNFGLDWTESQGLGTFSGNINGQGIGGFAGYNFQNGMVIYGIEAEGEKLNASASFAGVPGPGLLDASVDWTAGIRGRVGHDSGNVMPYVFLGASLAHLDTNAIGFSMQDSVHMGLSLGAGADIKIGQRAFARVEFVHSEFREEHYEYCLPGVCPADIKFDRNAVRVGVGMRF